MSRPSVRERLARLEVKARQPIDGPAIHAAILAGEPYPGAGDPRADRLAAAIKDMLDRTSEMFPNRPPDEAPPEEVNPSYNESDWT